MVKVAINGLGRIGRATFKIILSTPDMEVVAVNDLVSPENLAYLLKYDSVYGRYEREVKSQDSSIIVDGSEYEILSETDPSKLPWDELGVEVVFECTGKFTKRDELQKHLQAGAKKVILSANAKSDDIPTIVYGANEPDSDADIISCASCTTNCVTPIIEILGRRIGIKKAIMTTVHAYTATQALVDGSSKTKKFRRGRAAAVNLVPTTTGAARATGKALPEYKGKFDGAAVRAPVPVGSISDIVILTQRPTTKDEINSILMEESEEKRYRGVVGTAADPIVSTDIIQDSRASIVDLSMTQVVDGDLAKVMSWYDNEWGYSSQMVKTAAQVAQMSQVAHASR